jgi:hypothetical protein
MAHYNELNANLLRLDTYTVATVPSAAAFTGGLIYVSNGNGGLPTLAFSDGTNWKVMSIGATIS